MATTQKNISAYVGIVAGKNYIYTAIKDNGKIKTKKIEKKNNSRLLFGKWLREVEGKKGIKIIALGFCGLEEPSKISTELWLKHDITPHVFKPSKKPSADYAKFICFKIESFYDNDNLVKGRLGNRRKVRVSHLTDLDSYRKFSTQKEFAEILEYAKEFKNRKLKMVFINATAAGGGVALMRHALIRFYELLGVDVSWHVLLPNAYIFNITKKKFHNVIQGVASPEVMLTERNKQFFIKWSKQNFDVLRPKIEKADVIVIDDPQPAGLIPHIKKCNPKAKIIYRSHIQINTKLINPQHKQQFETWKFLWQFIKLADKFISHPIKEFVPPGVKNKKLIYLPASTDPLDGLNKKISKHDQEYYFNLFNNYLLSTGQGTISSNRPYLIQVARFDPSKGIPDVIESYRKIRLILAKKRLPANQIPQLVIVGNGSIDDPEGAPIYEETNRMLKMDTYAEIANDIRVARLPHHDQLLNTLLRKSLITFQLSHKEGFEVKVTEALMKGKPVIAYKTGGIVLQIRHGKTGFLVEASNTDKVAKYATRLILDKKLYKKMSKEAESTINHGYLTAGNASKWLKIALDLSNKNKK